MQLAAAAVVVEYPLEGGGRLRAIDGVSLTLGAGEAVALMGPTGSGKSTLAWALAGLVPLRGGAVLRSAGGGSVAMVLQRPESALFCATVREELQFGLELAGVDTAQWPAAIDAALAQVGLDRDFLERDPLALSGGEQRRVAIAAVLVTRPAVLVLDEPSAGLDAQAREAVHRALAALRAAGVALLVVTHDSEEAAVLCPRLAVLRGGRLVYDGPTPSVLGVPKVADTLQLQSPAIVSVAHAVGVATDIEPPVTCDERVLVGWIAAVVGGDTPAAAKGQGELAARMHVRAPLEQDATRSGGSPRDSRAVLLAFALLLVGVFAGGSLASAALMLVAAVAALVLVRVPGSQLVRVARPLLVLSGMIVGLQLLVGGGHEVVVVGELSVDWALAPAALRCLQIAAVLLSSLALGVACAPVELAAGLRWWLAPLRLLRVPIDDLALMLALGLSFVPTTTIELERLQLAQAARGAPRRRRSLATRLRMRMALLVPLLVVSFRRANQLAEALQVRGFVRGAPRTSYRERRVGAGDVVLVACAALLLAGALLLGRAA